MSKTFVMGDIHGAYRALRQCLERANFDFEVDRLICLGDICDGWPETNLCIDELLRVKHLTYILGNHDYWSLNWMTHNIVDEVWFEQGGESTMKSYPDGVPQTHIRFLERAKFYYLENNKLFVHAGIDPLKPLREQGSDTFLWNRSLAREALAYYAKNESEKLTIFDEVYIGHTPIPYSKPVHACEVWLMDTGVGWSGVLSMMNIDTQEIFTSDPVPSLYPGIVGRVKKGKN